jgi:type I restriction enzyme R subunit
MSFNEADTRAKLIDPKLRAAGWDESRIRREFYYTKGRVYLVGDEHRRKMPKKVDYLLQEPSGLKLALVEAKDESHSPGDGLQQAMAYAEALGVLFAYSSNGHGIEEFDFTTNRQAARDDFPSPEEIQQRYSEYHASRAKPGKKVAATGNPLLQPPWREAGGKELRYYQDVAVRRVIEEVIGGKKHILLTMATGTGKTFVAFQIAWKLIKSGYARRVLFLADRLFLRDQAFNTFAPFGDARDIIEEGKAPKNRDIYFSIYQAMYSGDEGRRLYQQYPRDFFDLIVVDECHRSGFGRWNDILQHFPNAIQFGMTATPKRDDNIDTYQYFGDPVYSYSLGQGIEDGFLATYKVHRVYTTVDKHGLKLEDARTQGAEIYVPPDVQPRPMYETPQFEREITLPDRTAIMCEHLAGLLRTFDPMQKSMVFCVNMEHANLVRKELQNRFAYLGFPDYAVRIVSEEPDARALLERFQDSDRRTPVAATTADLLTTGVDVPSVRNIVFMKPIASPVVFKQIVGRGSRIDETTGKVWFRVIDYTGATRLFDDWDRPPGEPPETPGGPRESILRAIVVDEEDGAPIADAKVTLLVGANEQIQRRTDADGKFVIAELPEGSVTVIVNAERYKRRQITLPTSTDPDAWAAIELRHTEEQRKAKIVVRGLAVHIADETYLELEATGERLTTKQYIERSRSELLRAAPQKNELVRAWVDRQRRGELLKKLEEKGIHPVVLASLLNREDADLLDVLSSIAYGTAVVSRDERADAVLNRDAAFLSRFGEQTRPVMEALLEHYRHAGLTDLERGEVFRLSPFDQMGGAVGVAKRFGGVDKLREAVAELIAHLYSREAA